MLAKLALCALLALSARAVIVPLWTYDGESGDCSGVVTTTPIDFPHNVCTLVPVSGTYLKMTLFNESLGTGDMYATDDCSGTPIMTLPAINRFCLPAGAPFGNVWVQWDSVGVLTITVKEKGTKKRLGGVDIRCTNKATGEVVRHPTCVCDGSEGVVKFAHLPWGEYDCLAQPQETHEAQTLSVVLGPTESVGRFEKARLKFRLNPVEQQSR